MPTEFQGSELDRAPMSWEYVAAFFDAEGCLIVDKRAGYNYVGISLQWDQKKSSVLYEIADFLEKFDVSVSCCVSADTRIKVSQREDVVFCIQQMMPYLRVKQERAIECLKYVEEILDLIACYGQRYRNYEKCPTPPLRVREAANAN